ncbi:MAG: anaerobic glycerol-3-phosphate dehydrogenase subunit C [Acidobacteria bacterium]|nr:anaerobic glycerol-3-phosphate dehydrogenase subunit C [Acidobacteriota bacterium]
MPFDPKSAEFWDPQALQPEVMRVFDICHGCRRCFNLCPSFIDLFNTIDSKGDEVSHLTPRDVRRVVDLCYECKLCYNHCPYTPPHRWDIDFPKLMLRGKMVKARTEGIRLREWLFSRTDLLGWIGTRLATPINWAMANRPSRVLLDWFLGIHRDRRLPPYARIGFSRWFRSRTPASGTSNARLGKVALFPTCSVDYNYPDIGKASVAVLERNGLEVVVPEQRCCGMPFLDAGDLDSAVAHARFNVRKLADLVRAGHEIVIPGPTCSLMLKKEYPDLVDDADAKLVSSHAYDICEYLMKLHERGKLDTRFVQPGGRVAYQIPCHLRAQNMGFKSRDLLKLIPGTQVEVIERCSAFDGSWGAKTEFYQISLKTADKLFKSIERSSAEIVASDCPLAGLQIAQGMGSAQPLHPIQILARAYGL